MNDDNRDLNFVRERLRDALTPLNDAELKVDLWPRMLRRLEQTPVTFGWFELILAGLVIITFAVFPDLLPAMLYHL